MEDESAEYQFCESRQLNMSTLRMTSEAKVKLQWSNHVCAVPPICGGISLRLILASLKCCLRALVCFHSFFLSCLQLQLKDLLCNAGFPDGK